MNQWYRVEAPDTFQKQEYWTVDVHLAAKKPPQLTAHLAKKNDENVEIANQAAADAIVQALDGVGETDVHVPSVEGAREGIAHGTVGQLPTQARNGRERHVHHHQREAE